MRVIDKQLAPPMFVVEGCRRPKAEWKGEAALAVAAVSRRLAMYPYARGEWESAIEDTMAAAREGLERGGRVAVFSEWSMAQPYSPTGTVLCDMMHKVGIEPRGAIVWLDLGRASELPEGVKAWQSPFNPPLNSLMTLISIGQVESRTRRLGPTDRAEMGLPYKSTLSALEWARCTWAHWIPENRPVWSEGGLPYEAVRRLVGLHTYAGESVLVLGASVSAALATLHSGRSCLIAAGTESEAERVSEEVAARDGEEAIR